MVKIMLFWVFCHVQAASSDAFQLGAVSIGRHALSNNDNNNNHKDQGAQFQNSLSQAHVTPKTSQDDVSVFKRAAVRVESEESYTTPSNIRTSIRWPLIGATTILIARWLPGVNLIAAYSKSIIHYPLPTKMATGALLATVGDALAQSRETKPSYDSFRAASFMCFDAAYRVFQHFSFPLIIGNCQGLFLGRLLPLSSKWTHFLAVTERTLTYQFLVVPLLYYPIFFTFTGFMQGLDWQATLQRGAQLFLPCWKRNLLFWIPTQYFMFGVVATAWQIPFVCVMGILWSTILSVTAGNAKSK